MESPDRGNTTSQPPAMTEIEQQAAEVKQLESAYSVGRLQTLPPELFLHTARLLPGSGIVALGHTCRSFYCMLPVHISDLFDRFHSPSESEERLLDQEEYLHIINTDEFEEVQSPTEWIRHELYFCHSCGTEHAATEFSIAALGEPSSKRRCLKYEGFLWICPEQIWSYSKVASFIEKPSYFPRGPCVCGQHYTTLLRSTNSSEKFFNLVVQAFPLKTFETPSCIDWVTINDILAYRHLRICPHTSLSDPGILRCFFEGCGRTFNMHRVECGCFICKPRLLYRTRHRRDCETCGTQVQFRLWRNPETGEVTIYILVGRIIKDTITGRSGPDGFVAAWKNYVFAPSEIKRLKEEWQDVMAVRAEDPECIQQIESHDRDPLNIPNLVW